MTFFEKSTSCIYCCLSIWFLIDHFFFIANPIDHFDSLSLNVQPSEVFLEDRVIVSKYQEWSNPLVDAWAQPRDLFGPFLMSHYEDSSSEESNLEAWRLLSFQEKQFKYAFEGYIIDLKGIPKLFFADNQTGETFWMSPQEFSDKDPFRVESFLTKEDPLTGEKFVKACVYDIDERKTYEISDSIKNCSLYYEICIASTVDKKVHSFTQMNEQWNLNDCILQLSEVNIDEQKIFFLEQHLNTGESKTLAFSIPSCPKEQ